MRDGEPSGTFQSLINPLKPIPSKITDITGIDNSMVASAPEFYEIAEELLDFIRGTVLVFHNAPFDLRFLAPGLKAVSPGVDFPVVDTLKLARRNFSFTGNSLGSIARQLGIRIENAHRAMDDVRATAEILNHFIRILSRDKNTETLEELLELQGGTVLLPECELSRVPLPVKEALRLGGILRFRYVTGEGLEAVMEAAPREIVSYSNYTYLVAYCRRVSGIRVFRLDRILGFLF